MRASRAPLIAIGLVLALFVTALVIILTSIRADALSCWDQKLDVGGAVTKKVGIEDEGGNTYFRMDQRGRGRACSGGIDIFNNTTFVWSAPCQTVKGIWLNPYPVAGVNRPRQYLPCSTDGVIDLGGKRYGPGNGDRCGGASGTIDRKWYLDDINFKIPVHCQK